MQAAQSRAQGVKISGHISPQIGMSLKRLLHRLAKGVLKLHAENTKLQSQNATLEERAKSLADENADLRQQLEALTLQLESANSESQRLAKQLETTNSTDLVKPALGDEAVERVKDCISEIGRIQADCIQSGLLDPTDKLINDDQFAPVFVPMDLEEEDNEDRFF